MENDKFNQLLDNLGEIVVTSLKAQLDPEEVHQNIYLFNLFHERAKTLIAQVKDGDMSEFARLIELIKSNQVPD